MQNTKSEPNGITEDLTDGIIDADAILLKGYNSLLDKLEGPCSKEELKADILNILQSAKIDNPHL